MISNFAQCGGPVLANFVDFSFLLAKLIEAIGRAGSWILFVGNRGLAECSCGAG